MSDTPAPLIHSIPLPPGAEAPFQAYVNGEPWEEGRDFDVAAGRINFRRPIRPQPRLGMRHKLMLSFGIGVYGDLRGDTLDLRYTVAGRPQMVNIPLTERTASRG